MNFVKDILQGNQNQEYIHQRFVRYSKGEFDGPVIEIKKSGSGVKMTGSCDYLNTIIAIILKNTEGIVNSNGKIISKEEIKSDLLGKAKKKKGLYVYEIKGDFDSSGLLDIIKENKLANYLLNIAADSIKLKAKSKLPKPGSKLDSEFFSTQLPDSVHGDVVEEIILEKQDKDFKKIGISHKYIIDEIVIPEEYKKDAKKARLFAKRKGIIKRIVSVDGSVSEIEKGLMV